jgi:hypothetical protein
MTITSQPPPSSDAPSGAAAGPPAGRPAPGPLGLAHQLGIFAFDIGAPIGCYHLLRSLTFSLPVARAVGAVLPASAAAWQLAEERRVDPVAVLVIATMALSARSAAWGRNSRPPLPVDEVLWLGVLLQPVAFVMTNLHYRRAGLFQLLGARCPGQP